VGTEKALFSLYAFPQWAWTRRKGDWEVGGRIIEGVIHLADLSADNLLPVEPTRGPEVPSTDEASEWSGASGAAVFCNGYVIAVQRHQQNPRRPSSLEAVPLHPFYENAAFRALLSENGVMLDPRNVFDATLASEHDVYSCLMKQGMGRFWEVLGPSGATSLVNRALRQERIPPAELELAVLELASRFRKMEETFRGWELAEGSASTLKAKAERAFEDGEIETAISLADQASACDLAAAEKLEAVGSNRRLAAAKAKAFTADAQMLLCSHDDAISRYKEAIAIAGNDALSIAGYKNDLGVAFMKSGDLRSAETALSEALGLRRDAGEIHGEALATVITNLAGVYHQSHEFVSAEGLYEEAIHLWSIIDEGVNPRFAISLNNLAAMKQQQGDLEEAERLFRRSLKLRQRWFGAKHRDVASSFNNLGELLREQGRLDKAEDAHQYALAIRKELLPSPHPEIAQSIMNIAGLQHDRGHLAEAEAGFRDAHEMLEATLDPNDLQLAVSLNNLGEIAFQRGRQLEAEGHFNRALFLFQSCLGKDDVRSIVVRHNLESKFGISDDGVPPVIH
jgi:tetratricopeptide (TPR) repeat protein